MDATRSSPVATRLREVAAVFLKLGTIGFGGPAAHIALMRDELVKRRRWLSDHEFADLLGATNLIPGPNSTEMAIHLGFVRAGWRGLITAGAAFLLPAFCIVLAFAWAYERYGDTPEVEWLLYGIKPVIIAVVVQAIWGLSRAAINSPLVAAVAVAVFALDLAGVNEIALLFGGALLVLVLRNTQRFLNGAAVAMMVPAAAGLPLAAAAASAQNVNLWTLFLSFLKIGSVVYGSGYVLLAFLRSEFVVELGWITDEQLLDAVAIGQVTPGPIFTTATFIGYLVAGFPGAVVATVAIFLPSFVFVAAINPLVPRLRRSAVMSALLDGATAAALGLMAAVTVVLARDAVTDWLTALLAVVSALLLLRSRMPSVLLIALGALVGLGRYVVVG